MNKENIPTRARNRPMKRKIGQRRKKTFLWLFRHNQKRGKIRPITLENPADYKFNVLRFGIFRQSSDVRSEFCPYRGVKHQTIVSPSIKCLCRHRTFCPTSLSIVCIFDNFIVQNFDVTPSVGRNI
ncbi:hypothetical protein, no similarity [Maudiozyma saulgeensis]|uniref:Uncharacterized protein n=1 Tax=Maudiozyma saulgeensis TaxID=1789683 RepID=A0A1X7QXR2_9SACH|nr:hypothetical protein, no similarity [Kazachstania saulgeensis]